jgi:hypothetical protein
MQICAAQKTIHVAVQFGWAFNATIILPETTTGIRRLIQYLFGVH